MRLEQLKEIQMVQLTIMDEIHRVCTKNNLRYYLIGGSALGSVRHKGFIPWDVDIDIAMPREDYEAFIHIYASELNSKFSCFDYNSDKHFFSPHAIVALNNSKVVFSITNINPNKTYGAYGLYVDILPLDKVPDDLFLRLRHKNQLKFIEKLRLLKKCTIYSETSKINRFLKIWISRLMPISLHMINKIQQKVAQKYNNLEKKQSRDICSTLSHYKYEKLCMPEFIWGTPKLTEFEGRKYYAQEYVNEYLYLLFGDYMKLPSKEDQLYFMELLKSVEWIDDNGIVHEVKD